MEPKRSWGEGPRRLREQIFGEVRIAVQAVITAYPELQPQKFEIPNSVPLEVFWEMQQSLINLGDRFCRHRLSSTPLTKVELRDDGSLYLNDCYGIVPATVMDEVYLIARPKNLGYTIPMDESTIEKLVRWLTAAAHVHPPLLDPVYNRHGQQDFLAAWRISLTQ